MKSTTIQLLYIIITDQSGMSRQIFLYLLEGRNTSAGKHLLGYANIDLTLAWLITLPPPLAWHRPTDGLTRVQGVCGDSGEPDYAGRGHLRLCDL